jgi:hypothetical protein
VAEDMQCAISSERQLVDGEEGKCLALSVLSASQMLGFKSWRREGLLLLQ